MHAIWWILPLLPLAPFEEPVRGACTKIGLYTNLDEADLFFVGSGAPDTVFAGPGPVEYGTRGGHYAASFDRPIYGQHVRIERIGGPAAARISSEVEELVVVPWDYDASCHPLAWGRSARWVQSELRGFFLAALRDREHWVDGIPTVDVHNPGGIPHLGGALSLDQLFELYLALPSMAEIRVDGPRSLERARAWVAAHPDLADRELARRLLRASAGQVAIQQRQSVRHPALGTWRFTIRTPEDSTYVVYGRTGDHPIGEWIRSREGPRPQPADPLEIPPPEGYTFLVRLAQREDALPENDEQARNHPPGHFQAQAQMDDSQRIEDGWEGLVAVDLMRSGVQHEPLFERLNREQMGRVRAGDAYPWDPPARFRRGPDGILRISQAFGLADGTVIHLEGEQVSEQVIRRTR